MGIFRAKKLVVSEFDGSKSILQKICQICFYVESTVRFNRHTIVIYVTLFKKLIIQFGLADKLFAVRHFTTTCYPSNSILLLATDYFNNVKSTCRLVLEEQV